MIAVKAPRVGLRRAGKVPAVFYGPKSTATPIAVDRKDFAAHVANLEGSHLIRFQSPAADLQQRVALVREVQTSPRGRRHPARRLLRGRPDATPAGHRTSALRRQSQGRRGWRYPAADRTRDGGRVPSDRHPAVHRDRRDGAPQFTTPCIWPTFGCLPNVDRGLRDQRGRGDGVATDGRRGEGGRDGRRGRSCRGPGCSRDQRKRRSPASLDALGTGARLLGS